jgi:hypothetical protein
MVFETFFVSNGYLVVVVVVVVKVVMVVKMVVIVVEAFEDTVGKR